MKVLDFKIDLKRDTYKVTKFKMSETHILAKYYYS